MSPVTSVSPDAENAFAQRSLGDTPNGRLARFRVNEELAVLLFPRPGARRNLRVSERRTVFNQLKLDPIFTLPYEVPHAAKSLWQRIRKEIKDEFFCQHILPPKFSPAFSRTDKRARRKNFFIGIILPSGFWGVTTVTSSLGAASYKLEFFRINVIEGQYAPIWNAPELRFPAWIGFDQCARRVPKLQEQFRKSNPAVTSASPAAVKK
jgi:hypothetical protein